MSRIYLSVFSMASTTSSVICFSLSSSYYALTILFSKAVSLLLREVYFVFASFGEFYRCFNALTFLLVKVIISSKISFDFFFWAVIVLSLPIFDEFSWSLNACWSLSSLLAPFIYFWICSCYCRSSLRSSTSVHIFRSNSIFWVASLDVSSYIL